ncbi:hypothetical protein AB5N19_13003 [Seiridium cardinale]
MSSFNGNSFPRGNSHTFSSYSVTRQNWQGRGRKATPPIPDFNPTNQQKSISKAPPSKRVRTEKDSEADKKPAEPKPKPGTREFAKWKLDLHKKNMVEAIEEKELATQKLASNRAKASV